MITKFPAWLRWLGVLPISIIVYLLAYALMKVFGLVSAYFGPGDDFEWVFNYSVPVFATGAAGYYYLKSGIIIAPNHKKQVAITLIVIMVLFMIFSILLAVSLKHWKTLLEVAGTIIGLVLSYLEMVKDNFED